MTGSEPQRCAPGWAARWVARVGMVGLTLGMITTACSTTGGDDGGERPPDSATTEPTPDSGPDPEPLSWEDCGGAECATLAAPLDWSDRNGPQINLGMRRVPASGDRIGALFVNPGGPGASATRFAAQIAGALPAEVTDRFDVVGVDPRGVGQTEPIDCDQRLEEMYATDPTPDDPADREALIDISQAYVDDCAEAAGPLLDHMGTVDVARDMDWVRRAMGDDRLSYLGFSYGTSLGQVYAGLFPARVRAMVLDGVVDLTAGGIGGARLQARGFQLALDNWAEDCAEDEGCPVADDPTGAVTSVLDRLEAGPLSPGDPLTEGIAQLGLAQALYAESRWGDLSQGLADALEGDGSGLAALGQSYLAGTGFSVYFGVNCTDSRWPGALELLDEADEVGEAFPPFGEAITTDYVRCSLWPTEPEPVSPPDGRDLAPTLVVSTTGDPATPYESGVALAERLDDPLLTYRGEGHTVVLDGIGCVTDPVVDYLVDLKVPDDITC